MPALPEAERPAAIVDAHHRDDDLRIVVLEMLFEMLEAVLGLLVVAVHVLAGIAVGGGGFRDLLALAIAPAYVAWKVALAPAIARASRRGAEWVRTERREEAKGRP
ncbi:MAG: hypothetical protein FJ144_12075 [Deltaproteobacteria bacterium]|nr:hypothetical protein [Deltaproteobacteria bacterium]